MVEPTIDNLIRLREIFGVSVDEILGFENIEKNDENLPNESYQFTFSKEEISRFIAYFMMQFSAMGNYWGQPFYLGGTNPDGSTAVNELSYLILDIYSISHYVVFSVPQVFDDYNEIYIPFHLQI